ncbi:MAG: radical SAM protein [Oscillospiraceae bacterium]|jgi:histone acetyltransferase (RNA polymerase elongator complex component)|nr:radical SAM protein [Oscillospiraceae bacterium]
MRHANVALFVPNNGCPHACSFCSQKSITGQAVQPVPEDVISAAETALADLGQKAKSSEIAFFGGSFTAVERNYMVSLLQAAAPYVKSGRFAGIRISTRPDAIDPEILSILKKYGVTTIELGAQSMDDRVLTLNERGHTSNQVRSAAALIRTYGFSLGLQMMTGLYGDTADGAGKTAQAIAACNPDCVRIYPTIVLKGTKLGKLFQEEKYNPPDLEETVDLCAGLLDFFERRHIPVIRLGLHASPELERDRLAGPWHPAFRELCESRRMMNKMTRALAANRVPKGPIALWVNPKSVSVAAGQKKANLKALLSLGYSAVLKQDAALGRTDFQICDTEGKRFAAEIAGTSGI